VLFNAGFNEQVFSPKLWKKKHFGADPGSTTLDRKRIYANPSSYSNRNLNPKAQLCFRTDKMTSFSIKCTDTANPSYRLGEKRKKAHFNSEKW